VFDCVCMLSRFHAVITETCTLHVSTLCYPNEKNNLLLCVKLKESELRRKEGKKGKRNGTKKESNKKWKQVNVGWR
jgi:hypothetical protein